MAATSDAAMAATSEAASCSIPPMRQWQQLPYAAN
jgi:hypothetical protein